MSGSALARSIVPARGSPVQSESRSELVRIEGESNARSAIWYTISVSAFACTAANVELKSEMSIVRTVVGRKSGSALFSRLRAVQKGIRRVCARIANSVIRMGPKNGWNWGPPRVSRVHASDRTLISRVKRAPVERRQSREMRSRARSIGQDCAIS